MTSFLCGRTATRFVYAGIAVLAVFMAVRSSKQMLFCVGKPAHVVLASRCSTFSSESKKHFVVGVTKSGARYYSLKVSDRCQHQHIALDSFECTCCSPVVNHCAMSALSTEVRTSQGSYKRVYNRGRGTHMVQHPRNVALCPTQLSKRTRSSETSSMFADVCWYAHALSIIVTPNPKTATL